MEPSIRKKRNTTTRIGRTAFSISPTGGPERVQHLIGNNIFCCKQALGSFWESEVEQKLTEAAAVCNSPCREVEGVGEKRQRPCDCFYLLSMERLDKGTEMPSESLENKTDRE